MYISGHGLCNHISKSSTLPLATDDPKIIAKECLTILRNQHLKVQDLRGVGIQIQRLESAVAGFKTSKGPASSILKFTVAKLGKRNKKLNFTDGSGITVFMNDKYMKYIKGFSHFLFLNTYSYSRISSVNTRLQIIL